MPLVGVVPPKARVRRDGGKAPLDLLADSPPLSPSLIAGGAVGERVVGQGGGVEFGEVGGGVLDA